MVQATYAQIRQANNALRTLTSAPLGAGSDGQPAPLALPFRTALKIKRIAGLLNVLDQQAVQQERELYLGAGLHDGDQVPAALYPQVNELYSVECEVGSEVLTAADLDGPGNVQASIVRVLTELGPFFVDDAPEAGIPVSIPGMERAEFIPA